MEPRTGLHEILCNVLSSFGRWLWDPLEFDEESTTQEGIEAEARKHVYFQPPTGFLMKYPCIVYDFARFDTDYAGNLPYRLKKAYNITVIDKDPDSLIPQRIAELPVCSFDRTFKSDNLYHTVFTIYY